MSHRHLREARRARQALRGAPLGVARALDALEQLAGLVNDRKVPILEDVRDESDEAVRIVLEPRSRTVDSALLEESLYKMTELEVRFPLNLNVLDKNRTPGVMSLKQALTAWLAFQIDSHCSRCSSTGLRINTTWHMPCTRSPGADGCRSRLSRGSASTTR